MSAPKATAVWHNRDFRLIWSAQTLSEFGNGLSQLAYPLLMLAITGSPAAAGALAAVRALPYLFLGLLAGALVDRWDRKRTMIFCDLARAANVASIPIVLATGSRVRRSCTSTASWAACCTSSSALPRGRGPIGSQGATHRGRLGAADLTVGVRGDRGTHRRRVAAALAWPAVPGRRDHLHRLGAAPDLGAVPVPRRK